MSKNHVFVEVASELSNYNMTVSVFLHIDIGVTLIGDVNMTSHCLNLAEIKGCQVRHWIVG